jgi:hypothetical protein
MTNLPPEKPVPRSNADVREFFDKYFVKKVSYPSNEIDAVVGFFENRGFDRTASIAVATVLLQQAKIDEVNIFSLIDTLKGLSDVQLSAVVTETLNYSRLKTSSLGYRRPSSTDPFEKRNIRP